MSERLAAIKRLAGAVGALPARLLFPPVCAGCARLVSRPGTVCAACWPRLRFLEPPWCPVMGTPFPHDMGEGFLSAEAIADPPPFARMRAAVVYHDLAARLVQGLKYGDRADRAKPMAAWMARAGFELVADADAVVPVPLHWRRLLARHYNQAAELARALARQHGIAYRPDWLQRRRPTRRQVGLGREQRRDNLRAAFVVPPASSARLAGRRVLLVDDVYTTGATARAASRALLRAGASAVDVLAFARVLPGDFRPDDQELI